MKVSVALLVILCVQAPMGHQTGLLNFIRANGSPGSPGEPPQTETVNTTTAAYCLSWWGNEGVTGWTEG